MLILPSKNCIQTDKVFCSDKGDKNFELISFVFNNVIIFALNITGN